MKSAYLYRKFSQMTKGAFTKEPIDLERRFQMETRRKENLSIPCQKMGVADWTPVIISDSPERFQLFQWGFVLFWMEGSNLANRTINADVKTVWDKPAFQEAIKKRRCLIPIDGFYEWQFAGGKRKEYLITRKDREIFGVAGIWEQFADPAGKSINCFLPLVHESNEFLSKFGRSMPFVLYPEYEALWLDNNYETADLLEIISPVYHDLFEAELLK